LRHGPDESASMKRHPRCAGARVERLVLLLLAAMLAEGWPLAACAEDRSIDGSGNNLSNADWGAAGTPFLRLAPSTYADGVAAPAGVGLANPRTISNAVSGQTGMMFNDRRLSDFAWQWGQFVDHDITLTETNSAEPLPIAVSNPGDPLFPIIPLSRSQADPLSGTGPGNPRQQLNSNTAFLDASVVYGSDLTRSSALRSHSGGRMLTGGDDMLPLNTMGLPNSNQGFFPENMLFVAGDVRANEQAGLIAMQTVFVREHNHWADQIASANPLWTDEQVFQRARKMVGAEIQAITYNEWLPTLLGEHGPGASAGYDSNVNPAIANEFAAATFRLGHTMVSPQILRMQDDGSPNPDGPLLLQDAFFDPTLMDQQVEIDALIKGMSMQRMQQIDSRIVDPLRNALFGPPGSGGLDLAALNIQRGREHGLPGYNQLRLALNLAPAEGFADITSDVSLQTALASMYGSVDEVDSWVGALAEDHLPGASVGELLAVGISEQFVRMRDGDRFFFQWDDAFSTAEREALAATRLSDVLARNTSVASLQENVFVVPEPNAGVLAALGLALLLAAGFHRHRGNSRASRRVAD